MARFFKNVIMPIMTGIPVALPAMRNAKIADSDTPEATMDCIKGKDDAELM